LPDYIDPDNGAGPAALATNFFSREAGREPGIFDDVGRSRIEDLDGN